jgi:ribosomal protein L19
MLGMINSCLDDIQRRQKIESKEQVVKQKVSSSDHIRRGNKVKVTIQTKDGSQSFEGVFVERYSNIIGIKTDKGKVAFGGSFVVEEIK